MEFSRELKSALNPVFIRPQGTSILTRILTRKDGKNYGILAHFMVFLRYKSKKVRHKYAIINIIHL